jgi:hypothetical protein
LLGNNAWDESLTWALNRLIPGKSSQFSSNVNPAVDTPNIRGAMRQIYFANSVTEKNRKKQEFVYSDVVQPRVIDLA